MPLLPISENNYSKQREMNHITVERVKSTMGFRKEGSKVQGSGFRG